MSDPLLADLTAAQLEAVTHLNGPMLVVAGAGSGKTRVVTRRIARLVAMGIKPWRILALTFTNKAAREMRDRVEQLVGEAPAWMGTFHSVCARMLRFDIHLLEAGRDNRFSIMDQGDQEGLVKQALKSLDIDDKSNKPSALLAAISKAKSDFISPEDFIPGSWKDEITHKVYIEYERLLRLNNAVDFDDLLVLAARLLQQSPAALMKYRNRFPHILVDEYQDTNRAQYRLLKALAGEQANLHATGDPDQSIYSWRGADYRNIMDFQNDFPGAKVVRLEENYRSSQNILAAANQLIRHNSHRLDKDLFTANPKGEPVMDVALQSDRMEALWIAERMSEMRLNGDRLGQMAVFYRTNAQSRALEEALMAKGIAYQLVGGVRFYERREIKDLLAHLKVRINPRDLGSLRRVVSCRPGIGDKTLDKIAAAASEAGETTMAFLASDDFPDRFKAAKKVVDFAKWCRELMAIDVSRADVAAKAILNHSGLIETMLAATGKDDLAEDRLENLHSLTARAGDFVRDRLENAPVQDEDADAEEIRSSQAIDLAAFLEDVALVADVDGWASDSDKATLMTLHSAKGLEFDAVFVAGLEEGMLPHRNCRTDEALEEERRLFYVGLTRARKRAFVTHAQTRYIHGLFDISIPSRFLEELPSGPVEKLDFADAISTEYGSGYFTDSLDAAKKRAGSGPFKAYDFDADFAQPDADFDFDIAGDFDPNPDFQPDPEPGFPDFLPPPEKRATPPAKGGLSWRPVAKKPKPEAKPSKFKPGDLVRHPTFGSGKVLTADRGKVMVQFFTAGTRLIYEELTQLTKE